MLPLPLDYMYASAVTVWLKKPFSEEIKSLEARGKESFPSAHAASHSPIMQSVKGEVNFNQIQVSSMKFKFLKHIGKTCKY